MKRKFPSRTKRLESLPWKKVETRANVPLEGLLEFEEIDEQEFLKNGINILEMKEGGKIQEVIKEQPVDQKKTTGKSKKKKTKVVKDFKEKQEKKKEVELPFDIETISHDGIIFFFASLSLFLYKKQY
jgi:hypothetical protein